MSLRRARHVLPALFVWLGACSLFTDTDGLRARASEDASAVADGGDAIAPGADGAVDGATTDASADADTDAGAGADATENDAGCPLGGVIGLGAISRERGSATPQLTNPGYDLFPSAMKDGSRFAMWFAHEGLLLYAEGASADGPWHAAGSTTPNTVTQVMTGAPGQFDRYPGSPSVIRVGGTYYAYYTGHNSTLNLVIALATSNDGILWARRNAPILTPMVPNSADPPPSLEGPSAFYKDGKFYLLFADTTAPGSEPNVNGDFVGQFLIRSADPAFASGVESFSWSQGWVAGDLRTDVVAATTGADVAFVPEIDRLLVVYANRLRLVDLTARSATDISHAPFNAYDHGLIREPDGTIRLATDCATLPIDTIRSVGELDGGASDLAHTGLDVRVR